MSVIRSLSHVGTPNTLSSHPGQFGVKMTSEPAVVLKLKSTAAGVYSSLRPKLDKPAIIRNMANCEDGGATELNDAVSERESASLGPG